MKLGKIHIDSRTLFTHGLFWLSWVLSFTFIQTISESFSSWYVWLMYYIITLPIFMVHNYLIAYWLLPITFFRQRYFRFCLAIVVFLIAFSLIELIISNYLVFAVFAPNKVFAQGYLNIKNIIVSGIGNHYIILVFLAIKAGGAWYRAEQGKEKLLRKKVETELELYRYQLQPKMVLTLMDELDIISEKEVDKTPEMIIHISNFLNDFLPSGKEGLIPLKSEVTLLKEFLVIHKQALGERLADTFLVNGNLNPFVVPPLLLLPFINSSIKIAYGCNESFEISVIIKAERNYLLLSFTFWSENPFKVNDSKDSVITNERLKYNFPGKYRLIENADDNFKEISIEIYA